MKIVVYSFVTMFIKIPFREIFRNPLLSLPGTFRDSVFLANWYHFGGKVTKKIHKEKLRWASQCAGQAGRVGWASSVPGPLLTKGYLFHFPFRI